MFQAIIALMRLDRPAGFWLLLWPTLAALTYGIQRTGAPLSETCLLYGIFICGTFFMRSAGCILNDLLDADFDGQVARTQNRPLATGAISRHMAMGVCIVLLALSAALLLLLPARVILFALLALPLIGLYPMMKRWTYWPQLFLGITFNWGIWLAWYATQPLEAFEVWPLFCAAVCWTVGYDTLYAVSDAPDDARIGLKSTALLFEGHVAAAVMGFYALACVFLWFLEGGLWYHIGVLLLGAILSAQVLKSLPLDGVSAFKAFKKNQWVGVLWWLLMWLT